MNIQCRFVGIASLANCNLINCSSLWFDLRDWVGVPGTDQSFLPFELLVCHNTIRFEYSILSLLRAERNKRAREKENKTKQKNSFFQVTLHKHGAFGRTGFFVTQYFRQKNRWKRCWQKQRLCSVLCSRTVTVINETQEQSLASLKRTMI